MRIWFRTAVLGTLLFASSLLAQEGTDFLADQEGYDEAVAAPLALGLYLNGSKNLGRMELGFEPAPEGSGATYKVSFQGEMQFGPDKNKGGTEALLDEQFRLVWSKEISDETKEGKPVHKEETIEHVGDAWVKTTVENGKESKLEIPYEPAHVQLLGYVLIARATIDAESGATHTTRCLEWKEGKVGAIDVSIQLGGSAPYMFRGTEVEAREVRFDEPDGSFVVRVGAEGQIFAIEFAEMPLAMIAGTAEEITQDIAGAAAPAEPGADDPRSAVLVYFRVLTGEKEPSALDAVFDWAAVKAEIDARDPKTKGMAVDAFAVLMKDQFRQAAEAGKVTKDQVDAIAGMLKTETKGDEATVAIPGEEEDAFRLKKTEKGWMIHHFPH